MNFFAFILLSLVLILASAIDLRSRKVPNWITYPGILVSLFWINSKSVFLILLAIFLLLIPGMLVGAGDIKLALLIALWTDHFQWSSNWLLFALIFGGVAATWLLIRKKEPTIAFAPYLAAGFLVSNLIP